MAPCGAATSRLWPGLVVAVVLVAPWCVREADGFSTPFVTKKVRLTLTKSRGYTAPERYVALSEVEFYTTGDARIPHSQVSCGKHDRKPFSTPVSFDSISDGDYSTKTVGEFEAGNAPNEGYIELECSFTTAYTVLKYKICTATDRPERDPASWTLNAKLSEYETSSDRYNIGDWFLLDKQDDINLPTTAGVGTCSNMFATSYDKEVYRFEWGKSRNHIYWAQMSEIDWYPAGGGAETVPYFVYGGNDKNHDQYQYAERADNLRLGSLDLKWGVGSSTTILISDGIDLIFTFPQNTVIRSYKIFTANDDPDRDPLEWKVYVLQDDLTWYTVDTEALVNPWDPNRKADYGNGFAPGSFTMISPPPLPNGCSCLSRYGFN
mmetsp:Transcript_2973/g.7221  ORF Transcript_2973/g.7221 Transcript_2973/m.7221 type:complete len:378 (-) Transcript_2973:206-1339(-)